MTEPNDGGNGPALDAYDAADLPAALTGEEPELPDNPSRTTDIPYHRINPPSEVAYEDYNYAQRRAVLLQRVERVGHPSALNQTYQELADEFGTVKSRIHDDMVALAEYMADNVDRDHVTIMDAVFRGAVRDLADDDEWVEAAEVGKAWYEWLADMGAVDRVADKLDLDATVRNVGDSEAYRVIEDDDAEALEYVEASEGER